MEPQVSVKVVTPEMANEWLSTCTFEHQRPVSSFHVGILADEMKRGTFKQDTAIEFSRATDQWVLTDGQHRLSAIVASKIPQRFVVVRRFLKSDDDMALDYTRTDKGKRRTTADDYKALMLESELGLTRTQLNKLGSAVALINSRFMHVRQATFRFYDRLSMMREYNDAYSAFLEASAGCDETIRTRLDRSSTTAIAIVTFRFSVEKYGDKVEEFWRGVIWDDGLKIGDPRKVANRHLLESGMLGGGRVTQSRTVTPAYSARYLANCFNAYAEGRSLVKSTKVFDVAKPILIIGSPFNGK